MSRRLRVTDGPMKGAVYGLRSAVVLGRSTDIDIQIPDKGVSRRHACIVLDDQDQMVLMDLSSKNGTFVGGRSVGSHVLERGDHFRVGHNEFVYEEVVGEPHETIPASPVPDPIDSEDDTQVTRLPDLEGCGDPLHATAADKGWKFCPSCGKRTSG